MKNLRVLIKETS